MTARTTEKPGGDKPDYVVHLKELIRLKEVEQRVKEAIVREQFQLTYESLKPLNLLRSAVTQVTSSPDLKGNLAKAALGIASGFIVKKVVEFSSKHPMLKLAGSILEIIVAGIAAKK